MKTLLIIICRSCDCRSSGCRSSGVSVKGLVGQVAVGQVAVGQVAVGQVAVGQVTRIHYLKFIALQPLLKRKRNEKKCITVFVDLLIKIEKV